MNFHDLVKTIENWYHPIVKSMKPALDYLEVHAPEEVQAIAVSVLTNAIAGTPWATLIGLLIKSAENAGKSLLHDEADIILNLIKGNLKAQGVATA